MLEAGMKAPEFALPDQNGKGTHMIKNTKREESDLIFYPRQHSGCTKEGMVSENYILNFQKKERLAFE